MPTRIKPPPGYVAPLRSRRAIVDFLENHVDYYRWHATCSPLAWDVKVHGIDLGFEHLRLHFRHNGDYDPSEGWLDDPAYIAAAQRRYSEVEGDLFDWAIEAARDNVTEEETHCNLWDGTVLDVSYDFTGRSGGWLIMTRNNGVDLTRLNRGDFADYLAQLPFTALRNLYRLVVQNNHDFRRENVEDEIEHCAAFELFENACRLIPRVVTSVVPVLPPPPPMLKPDLHMTMSRPQRVVRAWPEE